MPSLSLSLPSRVAILGLENPMIAPLRRMISKADAPSVLGLRLAPSGQARVCHAVQFAEPLLSRSRPCKPGETGT